MSFKLIHGIDVTNLSRPEYSNEELKYKILSSQELQKFNELNNRSQQITYLATHWAIKEAIFKSISPDIIGFCDMEVSKINNVYTWTNKPSYIEQFVISTSTEGNAIVASVYGLRKK